jgi:nitrogen fixation NifU-like protein
MTVDDRELFGNHVIEHYEDPYQRGPLEGATHRGQGVCPLSADAIQIELRIAPDGAIDAAGFDGEGCLVCQAAASMLVERIEGLTVEQVREVSPNEMLERFGPIPPHRQRCALLPWRVLQRAIDGPADDDEDGVDPGRSFGGPSLSEEN